MTRKLLPVDDAGKNALAELGNRLRTLRIMRSDTMAQMAQRLQCSLSTYAALEKGEATTQIGLLVNALGILGCLDSLSAVAPVPVESLIKSEAMRKRVRKVNPTLPTDEEIDF
ncbi:helix-turn-helix transcriptional regulator [Deefgea salmonis]|uniref:Helix-turn-helix domain-containing protein n=1 Tax=Deefgea salmonis TaxID=2875502 RepID=A0ABS8BPD3_9NEIS|nr:helix-turn-helix transcriptional regulator [Deefgea salmonis]MCB5197576.1 helix-turn-helix domain-containing protein [Deefgea salmonis]